MSNDSNTTQRDELALDIFLADNGNIPEGELRQDWVDAPDRHRPYAQNIADGLIAKGYRKPRTIETVEELDALDVMAVILSGEGAVFEKCHGGWIETGRGGVMDSEDITLPVVILWEPEVEVGE